VISTGNVDDIAHDDVEPSEDDEQNDCASSVESEKLNSNQSSSVETENLLDFKKTSEQQQNIIIIH
jgi:hypothetical protein